MAVLYAEEMKKAKKGRPRAEEGSAFTCRHVVNISPRMEEAVKKFAEANGVARITDAMRQVMTKALKAEGFL
jgi:hypothetical protein